MRVFIQIIPFSNIKVLCFVCLLVSFLTNAITGNTQITQPFRYEREQKNYEDYFNVISLEENGLALFRERDKYKNSNKIWALIFLDTALKEKHTLELEIK